MKCKKRAPSINWLMMAAFDKAKYLQKLLALNRGKKESVRKSKQKIVRCLNPACKAKLDLGVKFCDSCLTGICNGKVSIFNMGLVRREDLIWDRTQ